MSKIWLNILPSIARQRLEGRDTLQKVIDNAGWLFSDKIIRMGLGLVVTVCIARYLGPGQFGAINFAIAFVALFGAFASLGLDGIVVRDIVRYPSQKDEILAAAFFLKLCGGSLAFLFALLSIWALRPTDYQIHSLVTIFALGMIFQSFDTIDFWFQSQVQSKYTVLSKSIAFIAMAVVKLVLILRNAQLTSFAWAGLAEAIIGATGLVLFYRKKQPSSSWRPSLDISRKLLMESWPLIFSGLAIMIYMRIDQIMLAQIKGDNEVGIYSAALRFSEIWYFIPTIIVSSVMPSLTQARIESEETYFKHLQQLLSGLARIAYLIILPMTFLSSTAITFLYGQAYGNAGHILAIHIWTAIFVFMGVGMSPWIINENLVKFSLFQTVMGAVVNIVLNIYLIPKLGGKGAAISTLIAQLFAAYLALLISGKTRKLFFMETRALLLR